MGEKYRCWEEIFFNDRMGGFVLPWFENEKPPRAWVGLMDTFLHGAFSHLIEAGKILGIPGECVCFPIQKERGNFYFLLAGGGTSMGSRKVPEISFPALRQNAKGLQIPVLGISASDTGQSPERLTELFQGVSLWILP